MRIVEWIVFGMALGPAMASATATCAASSSESTGALLELYTSEGCNSCPPADRWFAQTAASADPRTLSLLAFHVDYWDEIGWPDRFAQHAFTLRQGRRVRTGGSRTVYTPQVMLSSQLGLRWNEPAQVATAVRKLQVRPAEVAIRMQASGQGHPGSWRVELDAQPMRGAGSHGSLYLALYEDGLSSAVKAGENAGVLLRHERVVRSLWGPWPVEAVGASRRLQVSAPAKADPDRLGLTAFVQDDKSGATLQALSLPLSTCLHAKAGASR